MNNLKVLVYSFLNVTFKLKCKFLWLWKIFQSFAMISEKASNSDQAPCVIKFVFCQDSYETSIIIHTVSDNGKITPGAMLNDDILVNTAEINQISVSAV